MMDGLSLLDLSDLPAAWRTIMRLLMREQPLSYAALAAAAASLPDSQRLQGAPFDEALTELTHQGYLVQQIVDGSRQFTAKIARKSGRGLSCGVWDALEPADHDAPAESEPPRRRPRANLWDSLS